MFSLGICTSRDWALTGTLMAPWLPGSPNCSSTVSSSKYTASSGNRLIHRLQKLLSLLSLLIFAAATLLALQLPIAP